MIHFKRICGCDGKEFFEVRSIPSGKYGDDWDAGCNMRIEGARAVISLMSPACHRKILRAVQAYCQALDVTDIEYIRKGKKKVVPV